MAKYSASLRRSGLFIGVQKYTRFCRERCPQRSAFYRFAKFVHGTSRTTFPTKLRKISFPYDPECIGSIVKLKC